MRTRQNLLQSGLKSPLIIAVLLISGCCGASDKPRETIKSPPVPEWGNLGVVDIVPCPKRIKIGEAKLPLANLSIRYLPDADGRLKTGAEEIKGRIKTLGGLEPEISQCEVKAVAKNLTGPAIIIGYGKENLPFKDIPSIYQGVDVWNEEQGYVIDVKKVDGSDVVVVWGTDANGALYGCITLAQLIGGNQKDGIYVREANVIDWPDFKYRMGHGARINDLDSAKRQIDWFLRYKFNMFQVFESERSKWPVLKEAHAYARERGISISHFRLLSIGSVKENAGDPRFKGALQYNGDYYCWSRDELLDERIKELQQFVKETGADNMGLHCLDSYDGGWPERCDKCRARFGDDRAAADAHVINRVTRGLRAANKDIILYFITQPYGLDLNLPGNAKYKDYYQRLTKLIPVDIFLVATGYDHDEALSWHATVKQPVVRWQNGATTGIGRYFDSTPCYFGGVFFPDRKDMAFLNERDPFFDGNIIHLVGMEYEWNTQSPGALILERDKQGELYTVGPYQVGDCRLQNVDAVFNASGIMRTLGTYSNTLQPEATCTVLLNRVCRSLYGTNIAPCMAAFLREGVKGYSGVNVAKSQAKNAAEGDQAYQQADNGARVLKQGMASASDAFEKSTLQRFYNQVMQVRYFYRIYTFALRAEEAVRRGDVVLAKQLLDQCRVGIEEGRTELKQEGVYDEKNSEKWVEPVLYKVEVITLKVSFMELRQQAGTNDLKDCVSVAFYEPSQAGGEVFPFQTLLNCLNRDVRLRVVEISDLREETLNKYRVLVIPQVARFTPGDGDRYRGNLRRFVIEKGGGVYFEHDAVGIYRSVINISVFPEICLGAKKREESVKVKVAQSHSLLPGLKKGDEKEHMYYDHIVLDPGPQGSVLLCNEDSLPVVMIGKVGKGRVMFNGMATLGRDGKEKNDADLIDKTLVVNGMKWLSGN